MSSPDEEQFKKSTLEQIQLVTLYILLNEYSEFQFKRVVKMSESLKVAIGKLEWFKEIHFFSWLLLKKMQDKTLKMFKIVKVGTSVLAPVQVSDRQTKVELSGPEVNFYPLG
jgi:hypothetical protein